MYKRYIAENIIESLIDSPVVLVNGARQVGKSTLCKSLLSEGLFNAEYITFDDQSILESAKADPIGFFKDLPDNLVLDEIQRAPELFLSLKKLIDDDRSRRKIILSGSANILVLPKLGDSLAGRMEIYDLWPLSQDEIRGKKSNFLDILLSDNKKFNSEPVDWKELAKVLAIGGYPESNVRTNPASRVRWFESYMRSILQKDIRELKQISGLTEIPKILQMIALRVGSTLNMASISKGVGVNSTTLKRYLSLLKHIFLIKSVPAWTINAEGRLVKSPKLYLNDTGLLSFLMGELNDNDLYLQRSSAGAVFENFVVMELFKQATWFSKRLNFFHFSMHQGAEVDIVIEQGPKRVYGIEVKTSASISASSFKGLKKLKELAKDRFKKGIILYTGDKVVSFAEDLKAVPISLLYNISNGSIS